MPTLPRFINAAHAVYPRDHSNPPPDLTPLPVGGGQPGAEVTAAGFYGAAFATPGHQVIVSFEGTHTSAVEAQPGFVLAQIAADVQIHSGRTPAAFLDAEAFAGEAARADAGGRGRGDRARGRVCHGPFARREGGGVRGGATRPRRRDLRRARHRRVGHRARRRVGIPDVASGLVNCVKYGDPVGNYSADPAVLDGLLHSPAILRLGGVTYIGDPLARVPLVAAGASFGPETPPDERGAGLAALAALSAQHRPLTTHAADLGVPLADPRDPGSGELFAELIARVAGGVLPAEGAVIA